MANDPERNRFCLALAAWISTSVEPAAHGITDRTALIEWTKPRIRGDASDLGHVIAMMRAAVDAKLISADDAWHVILLAGKLAQQAYRSWDDFAAALLARGDLDVAAARVVWASVPWSTELDVTLVDPTRAVRVLAARCPTCHAPRVRPSPTAYVYCDHCGVLMDYDFAVALSVPVQQPGPVFEQLRGQLAGELAATRERGDTDAYRALQRKLFEAWVLAAPTSVPPRSKDPAYRLRYVAWLAEAQVVADFDAEARAREAAMHGAVAKLKFISAAGQIRVPSDSFRALTDAMFDYEARRDELYVERGVYALHPDGASRELQRRIGFSLYTQAWLPMLEPAEGQALLARTQLAREYALVEPPATRATPCSQCGGPLAIVDGARRVVCDHCGRLVDVIG